MLSLLPLLLLLLRSVVALEGSIDGLIFKQALENLASETLGVKEIQVCKGSFQYYSTKGLQKIYNSDSSIK